MVCERIASQRPNDAGTELYMSLVDAQFNPSVPAVDVLNVRATCTNRDLPSRLPFGGKDGDFEVEGTVLLSRARCLTKPTETIRAPQRRAAQWRLISLNLTFVTVMPTREPRSIAGIRIFPISTIHRSHENILGIKKVESRKRSGRLRTRGNRFRWGLERSAMTKTFVGSGCSSSIRSRSLSGIYPR